MKFFCFSGSLNTNLTAAKDVNIGSFEETYRNRSENKSFGWNAGVAVEFGQGMSFGFTGGANYGKGHENADSTTHRNSHVGSRTGQTNITAGEKLSIKGGQVAGKGVTIDAHDLDIHSMQDTMTYNSKQQQGSVDVTIGYGFSGSASYSQSKINADYASVNEQSGIFAGDDGYQINIKNHTDLKGGIITSTQKAEDNGKNRFETGTLSFEDLANKAEYKGEAIGLGVSGSVKGDNPNGNSKIYTADKTGMSSTMGYGKESDKQHSTTFAGINTANITIRDNEKQQQITGRTAEETKQAVKTDLTVENYAEHSGGLKNNFDKDKVQNEIDLQVKVTQEFDGNRKALRAEINKAADEKRKKAKDIRKENYIDGKNGYNTAESLALDKSADKLEKVAFYTDLALGGLYGLGSTDALTYATGSAVTNPAVRAGTRPRQFWLVKCNGDSLYCSNRNYDDTADRKIYDKNGQEIDTKDPNYTGMVEIGDKRQIFDLNEIKPNKVTGTIVTTNDGILNPLNDALKNGTKQQKWAVNKEGILLIYNPPTGNWASEILYAGYDKLNDILLGSSLLPFNLPLTSAQKANIELNQYADREGYKIDSNNHSRGGLTRSVSDKYSVKHNLPLPYNDVQFFGSAANVDDYKDYMNEYNRKDFNISAATHYTDYVGRTPLAAMRSKYVVGGNEPTGGVEDKWFLYSHSSYFAEKPTPYLVNEHGFYMDKNGDLIRDNSGNPVKMTEENKSEYSIKAPNPYLDDFEQKWIKGQTHNKVSGDNPSLPFPVRTKKQQGE